MARGRPSKFSVRLTTAEERMAQRDIQEVRDCPRHIQMLRLRSLIRRMMEASLVIFIERRQEGRIAVSARLREIGMMDWGLQEEGSGGSEGEEEIMAEPASSSSAVSLGGLTTLSTVASMVATVGEAHLPAQLI